MQGACTLRHGLIFAYTAIGSAGMPINQPEHTTYKRNMEVMILRGSRLGHAQQFPMLSCPKPTTSIKHIGVGIWDSQVIIH